MDRVGLRLVSGEEIKPDGLMIEEKVKLPSGESFSRKYLRGHFLGKGGFAKCYEVTEVDTGKVFAAKVVVKASLIKNRGRQKLMNEIRIHRSLAHHNVVHFERFFEDADHARTMFTCSSSCASTKP